MAVSAQGGCAWTAVSTVPWLSVTIGATGQGPGAVTVLVQENDAPVRRTGTLTIAGQTYTVEQGEAVTPIPIPPVDPSCTFTVEPLAGQFGSEGGRRRADGHRLVPDLHLGGGLGRPVDPSRRRHERNGLRARCATSSRRTPPAAPGPAP